MAGNNPQLRVGVIGTGRRWRRHFRPALLGLLHRFDLRAVCDPVPARAEREARLLGCSAAAGPRELLSSSDIDAAQRRPGSQPAAHVTNADCGLSQSNQL